MPPIPARGTWSLSTSVANYVLDAGSPRATWDTPQASASPGASPVVQVFARTHQNLKFDIRSRTGAGFITSTQESAIRTLQYTASPYTYTDSLGTSGTVAILDFDSERQFSGQYSYRLIIQFLTLNYYNGSTTT